MKNQTTSTSCADRAASVLIAVVVVAFVAACVAITFVPGFIVNVL